MELKEKIAIVTGGAAGIGKGIATKLCQLGATVVIADINEALSIKTSNELEAEGHKVHAITTDVSNSASVRNLLDKVVERLGSVDILVNDAGVMQNHRILDMEESEWDQILSVNLKGAFLCSKAIAQQMISQGMGGRIVNIISTAAENARIGAAAYCASKAGLLQLTRVLALELGSFGITVNAVGPGLTITDSPIPSVTDQGYQQAFLKQVPIARPGRPTDIAQAVAFLASPNADYITGQALYVDGGYSAGKLSVQS